MNTFWMKWSIGLGIVIIIGALALILIPAPSSAPALIVDYKNATYTIQNQPVTLVDGRAQTEAAPGSASKIITQYVGNNAKGDLNGDGIPDLAFFLTQSGSGSGTFYYLVVALQTVDGGYQGTNAILLGDRIAPQTLEIRDGVLIANYTDRNPGEPFSTPPSMGVSTYTRMVDGVLTDIGAPAGLGEHCGGFIKNAPVCVAGLHCQLKVNMPDTGGVCVAD